jgi:hypothetical protein
MDLREVGYRDRKWLELYLDRVHAPKTARTQMFDNRTDLKQHYYINQSANTQVLRLRTTSNAGLL